LAKRHGSGVPFVHRLMSSFLALLLLLGTAPHVLAWCGYPGDPECPEQAQPFAAGVPAVTGTVRDDPRYYKPPSTDLPPIRLFINGTQLAVQADHLYIKDSRTMVPIALIGQALGGRTVRWDAAGQTAYLTNPEETQLIQVTIGQRLMLVDLHEVLLDTEPEISAGRTMVPLRAISEALGATIDVTWGNTARDIYITYQRHAGIRPIREQCARHRLDYDSETCLAGSFLREEVFTSFGVDRIVSLQAAGLFLGENGTSNIAYLNQVAGMHNGKPARSLQEALDATVEQVVVDYFIAEGMMAAAGLLKWYEPYLMGPARAQTVEERANEYIKALPKGARPTETGWTTVTQTMNPGPAAYQSQVSGQPYRIVSRGTVEISEYGVVPEGQAGRWFDSYEPAYHELIEAKSIGYESFLDKTGSLQTWWVRSGGPQKFCEGIRSQAQFAQAAGYSYQVRFESLSFMKAIDGWARSNGFADVTEYFWWAQSGR
jgi:hypothetical protein